MDAMSVLGREIFEVGRCYESKDVRKVSFVHLYHGISWDKYETVVLIATFDSKYPNSYDPKSNQYCYYGAISIKKNKDIRMNYVIRDSDKNGYKMYLFWQFTKGRYEFIGQVKLHSYSNDQMDHDGNGYNVYKFILEPVQDCKPKFCD